MEITKINPVPWGHHLRRWQYVSAHSEESSGVYPVRDCLCGVEAPREHWAIPRCSTVLQSCKNPAYKINT